MGYQTFQPSEIPVKLNKDKVLEEIITIKGKDYTCFLVLVGVPHVVIFVRDIRDIDIDYLGNKI